MAHRYQDKLNLIFQYRTPQLRLPHQLTGNRLLRQSIVGLG